MHCRVCSQPPKTSGRCTIVVRVAFMRVYVSSCIQRTWRKLLPQSSASRPGRLCLPLSSTVWWNWHATPMSCLQCNKQLRRCSGQAGRSCCPLCQREPVPCFICCRWLMAVTMAEKVIKIVLSVENLHFFLGFLG